MAMKEHVCPRCGYTTVQKTSIRAHYLESFHFTLGTPTFIGVSKALTGFETLSSRLWRLSPLPSAPGGFINGIKF
jgi:hypothetical protein